MSTSGMLLPARAAFLPAGCVMSSNSFLTWIEVYFLPAWVILLQPGCFTITSSLFSHLDFFQLKWSTFCRIVLPGGIVSSHCPRQAVTFSNQLEQVFHKLNFVFGPLLCTHQFAGQLNHFLPAGFLSGCSVLSPAGQLTSLGTLRTSWISLSAPVALFCASSIFYQPEESLSQQFLCQLARSVYQLGLCYQLEWLSHQLGIVHTKWMFCSSTLFLPAGFVFKVGHLFFEDGCLPARAVFCCRPDFLPSRLRA